MKLKDTNLVGKIGMILVKLDKSAIRNDTEFMVDQALETIGNLEVNVLTKEEFHSILCEFPPSIAEDSGQPEWTVGEIDKVWDFLVGKNKYIFKEGNVPTVDEIEKVIMLESNLAVEKIRHLATEIHKMICQR